jgi:hypothetical protein
MEMTCWMEIEYAAGLIAQQYFLQALLPAGVKDALYVLHMLPPYLICLVVLMPILVLPNLLQYLYLEFL